jgi:hypothetical protein
MAQVDPNIFQTALLQVAEATQAIATAAKAAAAASTSTTSSLGASTGVAKSSVDWSKLVNKLAIFDQPHQEGAGSKAFQRLAVATYAVFDVC